METCQKLFKLSLLGYNSLLLKHARIVGSSTLQYIPWVSEEQDNRKYPKQIKSSFHIFQFQVIFFGLSGKELDFVTL